MESGEKTATAEPRTTNQTAIKRRIVSREPWKIVRDSQIIKFKFTAVKIRKIAKNQTTTQAWVRRHGPSFSQIIRQNLK